MALEQEVRMIDIAEAEEICITIGDKFIWVSVDGLCRFRASIIRTRNVCLDNQGQLNSIKGRDPI